MWVRLHKLPKRFYKLCVDYEDLSPQAKYIKEQSLARYLQTDDGKYLTKVSKNLKPEIGRIDSVRFICT